MGEAPKLLDRVRDAIRVRHYSRRTEHAYVVWIRRYIVFHRKVHPEKLGAAEIERFLTWLAVESGVSASTQNQALSALLFLYREVLRARWVGRAEPARSAVIAVGREGFAANDVRGSAADLDEHQPTQSLGATLRLEAAQWLAANLSQAFTPSAANHAPSKGRVVLASCHSGTYRVTDSRKVRAWLQASGSRLLHR